MLIWVAGLVILLVAKTTVVSIYRASEDLTLRSSPIRGVDAIASCRWEISWKMAMISVCFAGRTEWEIFGLLPFPV